MISFKENLETTRIINPISSDLGVLRNSLSKFDILHEQKLNRGFGDQSLFEIGPVFTGKTWRSDTVVCN